MADKVRRPERRQESREPARCVYVAGVLALSEPGPAGAGMVITDAQDRVVGHRAAYLGTATRTEATARALLMALQHAQSLGLAEPVFRVDDPELAQALQKGRPVAGAGEELQRALAEARQQLPGHRLEVVAPASNPARTVALAPLIDWLPERTRRAEQLQVRPVGEDQYDVESQTRPGQVYRVLLRPPGTISAEDALRCECADFQYRGIPCKHLLAVAREAGILEHLFYAEIPHPRSGGEDHRAA